MGLTLSQICGRRTANEPHGFSRNHAANTASRNAIHGAVNPERGVLEGGANIFYFIRGRRKMGRVAAWKMVQRRL
jgi:hypothetical protein